MPLSRQEEMLSSANRNLLANYRPGSFVLVRGRGCRVEDAAGRTYLDLSGGVAVTSVGHAHPRLAEAIAQQAQTLIHTSNLFYNERAIELAAQLVERTGFERVFFCNSGTEANEALLKLSRRWHYQRGNADRHEFIAAYGSFHGRTLGALSVTGQTKYHEGMGPLLPGVRHVPYNDLEALQEAIGPRTAAVILEPLQGEGGLVVGDDDYLRGARELCDQAGALLLFDEVQTGYGRTGRFLGREWSGVMPDACALAKGMGGGFPIGATLITERLSDGLPPGSHASTFGGNPLACAAGLAVLSIFDEEHLLARAEASGRLLEAMLRKLVADETLPTVEARGRGLLRGIRLTPEVDPVQTLRKIQDEGLLLSIAGGDVLRFAPPLSVSEGDLAEGCATLERVLRTAPHRETP